jgi:hypothetical protein
MPVLGLKRVTDGIEPLPREDAKHPRVSLITQLVSLIFRRLCITLFIVRKSSPSAIGLEK